MQNAARTPAYLSAVAGGALATERGIHVSAEDILRRAIIERLMCDLWVDLDALCRDHEFPPESFTQELCTLEALRGDGLVALNGRCITVTGSGRPLLRVICAAFGSYLRNPEARYSRAI